MRSLICLGHLDEPSFRHHDAVVRTTLTIDDDLVARLKEEMHRRRVTFREVVNSALRVGLLGPRRPRKAFKVKTYASRLRPGFDAAGFNALADELEDEARSTTLGRAP